MSTAEPLIWRLLLLNEPRRAGVVSLVGECMARQVPS